MHFSKALQPGLHIPPGVEEVFHPSRVQRKTSESVSILNKNLIFEKGEEEGGGRGCLCSCSIIALHWKGQRNKPGTDSRFYVVVFAKPILRRGRVGGVGGVAESLKVTGMKRAFPLHTTASPLCVLRARVPPAGPAPRHSLSLSLSPPTSAPFHWMSQFLIDVFSKALLVQSLPVLVFFGEITNCSAKSIAKPRTLGRTRPPNIFQGTWATLTAAVVFLYVH